jgi:hypothetical protein
MQIAQPATLHAWGIQDNESALGCNPTLQTIQIVVELLILAHKKQLLILAALISQI